jgi:glutathione S-transferase
MALSYARFVAGWVDTTVHVALFPIVVGDLYDRVRPEDQPYFQESRGKRLGTTDFAAFQAKARDKGIAAFRSVVEPARRVVRDQKFLAGEHPAYPDYALAGAFMWARIATPFELLEPDDPIHAWRERMLDLFDGMGRKAKAA